MMSGDDWLASELLLFFPLNVIRLTDGASMRLFRFDDVQTAILSLWRTKSKWKDARKVAPLKHGESSTTATKTFLMPSSSTLESSLCRSDESALLHSFIVWQQYYHSSGGPETCNNCLPTTTDRTDTQELTKSFCYKQQQLRSSNWKGNYYIIENAISFLDFWRLGFHRFRPILACLYSFGSNFHHTHH